MENLNVDEEAGWARGPVSSIRRSQWILAGSILLTALLVSSAFLLFGTQSSHECSCPKPIECSCPKPIECAPVKRKPVSNSHLIEPYFSKDRKAIGGFLGFLKLDAKRFGMNQYMPIEPHTVTQGWDWAHRTSLKMSDSCAEVELKIRQANTKAYVEMIRFNPLGDSQHPACGVNTSSITFSQDRSYVCRSLRELPCYEFMAAGSLEYAQDNLTDQLVGELVIQGMRFEIDRDSAGNDEWSKPHAHC